MFLLLPTPALTARAATQSVTYVVDPARSSLTLSGTWQGHGLFEVGLGSLVAPYTGAISANRDLPANTVQFTGGAIAAQNTGAYVPPAFPGLPGNYGFSNSQAVPPSSTAQATSISTGISGAVRNFSLSITSSTIISPSTFDVSQVATTIASGEIDYFTAVLGSSPMMGGLAVAPGSATLVETGGVETLTLPINTDFTILLPVDTVGTTEPLYLHFSGAIVANLPEPGTVALVSAPMVFVLLRRGWRRRVRG